MSGSMDNKRILKTIAGYNFMFLSLESLRGSEEYGLYAEQLQGIATILREITASGSFSECLEAIEATQNFELNYLAKSETDRENILASQKNISQGRHHYEILENDPESYRRYAKGYVDRDRLAGGIPNDGMHKALKSHLGHLRARYSLMLSREETDFLDAQVELVAAMVRRYQRLQSGALHKNAKPEPEDFPR